MRSNWNKRNRPSRPLPADWIHRVIQVKNRAQFQCEHIMQHNLQRCPDAGTDVDHIIERSDGGSDDLDNLQLLCEWHHKQKTSRHAGMKSQRLRRAKNTPKKHPGIYGI